jgi:hypothetical protein
MGGQLEMGRRLDGANEDEATRDGATRDGWPMRDGRATRAGQLEMGQLGMRAGEGMRDKRGQTNGLSSPSGCSVIASWWFCHGLVGDDFALSASGHQHPLRAGAKNSLAVVPGPGLGRAEARYAARKSPFSRKLVVITVTHSAHKNLPAFGSRQTLAHPTVKER